MDNEKLTEQFFGIIKKEMAVTLATAAAGRVTMRAVSPVPYEGRILLFTGPDSTKHRQLREDPRCCLSAGPFYAEAAATWLGPTSLPENGALRAAYSEKFPGAFDENEPFGGSRADFFLLRPTRLTGWTYPDGAPRDGIPTVPFDIEL